MAALVDDDPNVIAIDLINEPRSWPPIAPDPADSSQNLALDLYDDLITAVRAVEPDKILLIEAVYGESFMAQADFGRISATNRQNVALSMHNYYGGGHPTGWSSQGHGLGFWTWRGDISYPIGQFPRSQLQGDLQNHVQIVLDVLEPWGVPLHIGEFGIDPTKPHAQEWVEDILAAYDAVLDQYDPQRPAADVQLSRTWWRWSRDAKYQLYDEVAGQVEHQWVVDLLTGPADAEAEASAYLPIVDPTHYRADNHIRRRTGAWVGDNRYNATGTRQTRTAKVRRRGRATYYVRVQNDGSVTDSFTVKGTRPSRKWIVKYFSRGKNISKAVKAGRYRINDLDPRVSRTIRLVVTARGSARKGNRKTITVVSSSVGRPTAKDAVKAVTWRR